jgi:hypothetical protein
MYARKWQLPICVYNVVHACPLTEISMATSLSPALCVCTKWGRRLERWPYSEARLAGWRRVTQLGEICVVMDTGQSVPPFLTDLTGYSDQQELLSCELLANPAAVFWCFSTECIKKHRHDLYHVRKAWVRLYVVRALPSLWCVLSLLCGLRPNSWTKSWQKSTEFSSLLFTVISTALPWDLYFFKLLQPLTVSVKKKGGKTYRKPYPLPYGLRNPYTNIKSENSQDYAEKLQLNWLLVNPVSGCILWSTSWHKQVK